MACGGFYFNHGTFSDPFNGNPTRTVNGPPCQGDCTAAYRLLIDDSVDFGSALSPPESKGRTQPPIPTNR